MTTELANGLEFYNSVPQRFEVLNGQKPQVGLPMSIKSANYYALPSSFGTTSSTGTQYVITGQPNVLYSKYFLEEATIKVSGKLIVNGAGAVDEDACIVDGFSGVRSMCLTNMTQSLSMQINGKTITFSPQDSLLALLSFNKTAELQGHDLVSASMLEAFADVKDATKTSQAACPTNPYRDYFNTVFSGNIGNLATVELIGIENPQATVGAGGHDWSMTFKVREPIICGATDLVNKDSGCFSNVNTLQFNRVFGSKLFERVWKYAPAMATNVFGINVSLTNTAIEVTNSTLYYAAFSPIDSFKPKIQYHHFTNYDAIQQFKSSVAFQPWTGANQPSANVQTISSGNIQISRIPKALYIWVAMPNAEKTVTSSDAPGFHITNIELNYNNQPGIFSSMRDVQIYQEFMNVQGYVKTYAETLHGWQMVRGADYAAVAGSACGLYGSVLRIDGTQLAAAINWDKLTVGSDYTSNLSVNVTAYNLASTARTPTLFVLPVYDSWLVLDTNNTANIVNGVLDSADVEKVRASGNYEYELQPAIGAGLLGRHGKKIVGYLKKHLGKSKGGAIEGGKMVKVSRKSHSRRYKGGSLHDDDEWESDHDEYEGGNILTKADIRRRMY